MKEAENKREKLLNSNPKVNFNRRETKESKKIRDANTTTLMLIVVISVSTNQKSIIKLLKHIYGWIQTWHFEPTSKLDDELTIFFQFLLTN